MHCTLRSIHMFHMYAYMYLTVHATVLHASKLYEAWLTLSQQKVNNCPMMMTFLEILAQLEFNADIT